MKVLDLAMRRKRAPNPTITQAQILTAPTAMQVLNLKILQTGASKSAVADYCGISISYLKAQLKRDGEATQFKHEVLEALKHNPDLKFSADEFSRFFELHSTLVNPHVILPDSSITAEQLLATQTLGAFLKLKAAQLGIDKMDLHGMAGVCQTSMAAIRKGRKDARQLTEEALQRLTEGLHLSDDETAHMHTLNAKEVVSQNRANTYAERQKRHEVKAGVVPSDACWEEKLSEQLFMRHFGQHSENYVLPTPAMMKALDAADAASWNKERGQQLLEPHQLLYLRGYSKSGGKPLASIAGFDLSRSDLTDVSWAAQVDTTNTRLDGAALADIGRAREVYLAQVSKIPIAVRSLHQQQNTPGTHVQSCHIGPRLAPQHEMARV